jgi:hypothetical protein
MRAICEARADALPRRERMSRMASGRRAGRRHVLLFMVVYGTSQSASCAALAQDAAATAPPQSSNDSVPTLRSDRPNLPAWANTAGVTSGPVGRDTRYFPAAGILDRSAAGYRIGDFLVSGTVSGSLAYDSNVDAESDGDPGAVAAANLSLRAEPLLQRHSVVVTGSVSATGIFPEVNESDLSLALGTAGTLDLSPRDRLDGVATYVRSIESPTSTGATEANSADNVADTGNRTYDELSLASTYRRLYPRGTLAVGPSVTAAFYEDDSSGNFVQPAFSTSYERIINPTWTGTVGGTVTRTIFPNEGDDDEGDSTIFGVSVGAAWQPRRNLSANLAVGVERVAFDDSDSQGRTGFTFSGGVAGPLGERTRASLTASRQFDVTSDVEDSEVATVTQINAALDRQLARDLTGSVQLGAAVADYQGTGQTDYVLDSALGLAYALRDNLTLTSGLTYARRLSDVDDDVDEFVATVGLTLAF